MLNSQTSSKINLTVNNSFSLKLSMPPLISQNIHPLLLILYLLLKKIICYTEVGDPFINQEVRYLCPFFGILNFTKPKRKLYLRHTWSYGRGDYNLLGENASTTLERICDQDVNKHVKNITNISLIYQ